MGLATAKLLASRGASLSLADRNGPGLQAALKQLGGGGHIASTVDVTRSSDVDAWIAKTIDVFGKLDGALNMAGIFAIDSPVINETDENWDRMMNINARGTFFCVRAQLRAVTPGGSIVCSKHCE